MKKALIIDDEPLARKRIRKLLGDYHTIEVVGETREVLDSIEVINEKRPDILFLDIQLKAKKGFQILESIDYLPLVIFTTAYSDYAIKAFDYYAVDYLLKPFNDERFHRSVARALDMLRQKNNKWEDKINRLLHGLETKEDVNSTYLNRIPVKMADKTYFVETAQIKYIKASAYYAEIFAENGKHIIRESLSNLIKNLDPKNFIRVHRSSIANLRFLKEVSSIGFGDIEVKMVDGAQLRVSKSYKDDLIKKLGLK